MNTNIEVLRELDELVEAARLLGVTQAKKGFGCHTDEDSRFERAMYESIDKRRAALLAAVDGPDTQAAEIERLRAEVERSERYAEQSERERLWAEERAERLAEALALLPDEIVMVEHNPYEGPLMFCCGQRVTLSWHHGLEPTHGKECWYARMRALRDHDQENKA